jgi:uncharacterized protein (TIGR02246 family)
VVAMVGGSDDPVGVRARTILYAAESPPTTERTCRKLMDSGPSDALEERNVLASQSALVDLAGRYSKAWNDRDVESILALHSDDSTFHVHGVGARTKGKKEIRGAFEAFFRTWSHTHFEGRARDFGEDHWVLEYTLHATLSAPLLVGTQTIEGRGQEVSFEGVDIIRVSKGQVASKDSYIDGFAVLAQLTST